MLRIISLITVDNGAWRLVKNVNTSLSLERAIQLEARSQNWRYTGLLLMELNGFEELMKELGFFQEALEDVPRIPVDSRPLSCQFRYQPNKFTVGINPVAQVICISMVWPLSHFCTFSRSAGCNQPYWSFIRIHSLGHKWQYLGYYSTEFWDLCDEKSGVTKLHGPWPWHSYSISGWHLCHNSNQMLCW